VRDAGRVLRACAAAIDRGAGRPHANLDIAGAQVQQIGDDELDLDPLRTLEERKGR